LRILNEYISLRCFDGVIVNTALPSEALLAGYLEESAEPVKDDLGEDNKYALQAIRADLVGTIELEGKPTVKHDPHKLARVIIRHTRAFSRGVLTP
jgi:hypothetical protein